MTGEEFEKWCVSLLENNGFYAVERVGGAGDQGVDIIDRKDRKKICVPM